MGLSKIHNKWSPFLNASFTSTCIPNFCHYTWSGLSSRCHNLYPGVYTCGRRAEMVGKVKRKEVYGQPLTLT